MKSPRAWILPGIPALRGTRSSDGRLDYEDDSEARSQFGTKEYWDELYEGRGEFPREEYSWYFRWGEYESFVRPILKDKTARILLPGVGNDPIILDLLQNGYRHLTATDYSQSAIDRQEDLLSYAQANIADDVILKCVDSRQLPDDWTDRFDAVLEKGALDAIFLSGDGNVERAVDELHRVVKPSGIIVSIQGVCPPSIFDNRFKCIRDGSKDLKAGCFVIQKR